MMVRPRVSAEAWTVWHGSLDAAPTDGKPMSRQPRGQPGSRHVAVADTAASSAVSAVFGGATVVPGRSVARLRLPG